MRAADEASFKALGVPSRTVMEMAGQAICDFLLSELALEIADGVIVYFGSGNNGGDGLVVARRLHNLGIPVAAVGVDPKKLKEGAADALKAYLEAGGMVATDPGNLPRNCGVAIDAVYGIGFRGIVPEEIQSLIASFNASSGIKVSIDIPSGLEADCSHAPEGPTAEPDLTLALHLPKFAHVFFPAAERCGEVYVIDIGLVNSLPEIENLNRGIVDDDLIGKLLSERRPFEPGSHKGTRGRVTIVGGSEGSLGAPKLAALGAFRAGAGLITMASPDKNIGLFPDPIEVMTQYVESGAVGSLEGQDALVLGPGLAPHHVALVAEYLSDAEILNGIVIDAGALNILANETSLREKLSPKFILTPHPGEMSRLLKKSIPEIEANRVAVAEQLSTELDCVVVLKGASTVVATPGEITRVCPIAEPTLGVAGSGDVLAGVIGALLGQGYRPSSAAIIGVYLHARAGQLVAERLPGGALASEIAVEIPTVRQTLTGAIHPYRKYLSLRASP